MMFGLIGACLAMYQTAKPENKKVVGGLLFSAALTSFMTGITEPIEFSFLFVAPALYVLHAFFDGCAFMIAHILQITVGQTFSGGCIDLILFGVLQGDAKTNWLYIPMVGIPWFFLYYFSFKYLILKFDFKTLGREDETEPQEAPVAAESASDHYRADLVIEGLGGRDNIEELDCCATRLRVTVKDAGKVSERLLKESGSRGLLASGNGVQVIYGPQVTVIKNEVEEQLNL